MAKQVKTVWYCTDCGADSPKWQGKCPACGQWNTLVEERVTASGNSRQRNSAPQSAPTPISQIKAEGEQRINMPSQELNRVLGGGLVTGSMVLIGGEPGIGKSTLVLQNILAIKSRKILYCS